uniref:GTP diphosphokinase n=2 Tax=Congzhengia minquanensis TaxID=2763657 RepID=A0A926DMC8_9FIRM|nr:bifunctional (p)ppGpp synthetase/guanosine-3',5'-bis(diphosphate) 3'-pyrophosphohydrolase [Congzhengia minquanensis]MBC8540372.1 bifunctional (p)ppGpp synthetase/guanosine-3',5'-bis(diphosphate) 3'-pyrophosphohydrolase [Congzhengia minquanensis]
MHEGHDFESLKKRVLEYNANFDIAKLEKAYELARTAHEGQMRESGEPYLTHPLEVAYILADLELDCDTLVGALLHDVVEDTSYTVADINREFGESVGIIVDGVTKLSKIQYTTAEEQQVENLRKMFLAMAKDVRVILIKLADRLHNMRTIKAKSEKKQREKARETLEVYAALAHRLGMSKIKWELEDLSLKYIDPVAYKEITESINLKKQEREQFINDIMDSLKKKTDEMGINSHVMGRAKHFYSIYRKMFTQNKSIDELYDLFAVRIIVDSIKDCYAVLGMVHELYYPIPGRFKDYIAMPKPNMYQSLHTTVIGPDGTPFEIQIRTWEMHRVAEFGIAAHWKYKEGVSGKTDVDAKLEWIRQLLEIQNSVVDTDDFMRTLKIDLFTDEVFVFTPKGDIINLPAGSTPIDFAFSIHSAVGCKMAGVKVNGKITTLDYILQNGDIVDIMTSSAVRGPSRDWLKLCKTSGARSKINQWLKRECRDENIQHGKELIDRELRRVNLSHSQLFRTEWVDMLCKKYSFSSLDDIYAAVGYGGLTVNKVVGKLREEYRQAMKKEKPETEIVQSEQTPQKKKKTASNGVIVEGIEGCLVRFSRCCNPVPGDDIIGYITRGRGVSVHRKDCTNIVSSEKHGDTERLINVYWEKEQDKNTSYLSEIQIMANDRKGLLAEIASTISELKILITGMNLKTTKNQTAVVNIVIEINSTDELNQVVKKIRNISGVYDVQRKADGTKTKTAEQS